MNISLKKFKEKQPSNAVGYGLNKRGNSVFNNDASSSDEGGSDHEKNHSRSSVQKLNKDLLAEQEALKKRAEFVMNSAVSSDIYDYDGQYESFSHGTNTNTDKQEEGTKSREKEEDKKKSRYIGSLLNHAKERKYEREIILERKIAREQAEEEKNEEFSGKDKFVTKSYKRKLEEREAWKRQDDAKNKLNDENDSAKKKEEGLIGFYKNISLSKSETSERKSHDEHRMNEIGIERQDENIKSMSKDFLPRDLSHEPRAKDNGALLKTHDSFHDTDQFEEDIEIEEELEVQTRRVKTIEKILSARERYLNRLRVSEGSASLVE